MCRRALEQAETNARKQSILKPRAFGSPLTSPQKGYKGPRPVAAKAGQVDLPQIMKVSLIRSKNIVKIKGAFISLIRVEALTLLDLYSRCPYPTVLL